MTKPESDPETSLEEILGEKRRAEMQKYGALLLSAAKNGASVDRWGQEFIEFLPLRGEPGQIREDLQVVERFLGLLEKSDPEMLHAANAALEAADREHREWNVETGRHHEKIRKLQRQAKEKAAASMRAAHVVSRLEQAREAAAEMRREHGELLAAVDAALAEAPTDGDA